MPRMGNFCLTSKGNGPTKADITSGADVTATSSSAQHSASNVVDGNAQSYWASALDPASGVDMTLDFGAAKTLEQVVIDWEHPPLVLGLKRRRNFSC